MKDKVRVASGQGFWGDLLTAPVEQVRGGAIDYLMLDYLAEVTMSILQKQKSRDPNVGYARDFVSLMREILPDCVGKNIKVTDQEITKYMEENKESLPETVEATEAAALKVSIKNQLQQQKLSEKVQEWLANLQKNAKINYLVNF